MPTITLQLKTDSPKAVLAETKESLVQIKQEAAKVKQEVREAFAPTVMKDAAGRFQLTGVAAKGLADAVKDAANASDAFNARLRATVVHNEILARQSPPLAMGFVKVAEAMQREAAMAERVTAIHTRIVAQTTPLAMGFAAVAEQARLDAEAVDRIHAPMRTLQEDVARLERLHNQGKLSAASYNRELERVAKQHLPEAGPSKHAMNKQAMDTIGLPGMPKPAAGGGIPGMAMQAAPYLAAAAAVVKLDGDYVRAENSLRKFHNTEEELQVGLARITDVGYDLHMNMEEAAKSFDAVGEALSGLHLTSKEQIEIFRGLGEIAKIDGSTFEEMSGIMKTLQYGMEVGNITGLEMKRMMKGNDDLAKVWADSLGLDVKGLAELAKNGGLTTEKIRTMMLAMKGTDETHKKAAERSVELADRLNDLANKALEPLSVSLGRYKAKLADAEEQALKLANAQDRLIESTDALLKQSAAIDVKLKVGVAFGTAGDLVSKATKQIADFNMMLELSGATGVKTYHDQIDALNRVIKDHPEHADLARRAIKKLNEEQEKGAKTAKAHRDAMFGWGNDQAMDRILAGQGTFNPRLDVGDNDTSLPDLKDDPELAKVRALYDEIKNPMEEYEEKLAEIAEIEHLITNSLAQRMKIKAKETMINAELALQKNELSDADKDLMKKSDEYMKRQQEIANGFASIASGIGDAVMAGEDFNKTMVKVAAQVLSLLAVKAMAELFGGSGFELPGLPGHASGAVYGPTGGGTSDTEVKAFRHAPSETIRVHTPEQEAAFQRGNGGGGAGGAPMLMNFHLPAENFETKVESQSGQQAIIRVVRDAFPQLRRPTSGK